MLFDDKVEGKGFIYHGYGRPKRKGKKEVDTDHFRSVCITTLKDFKEKYKLEINYRFSGIQNKQEQGVVSLTGKDFQLSCGISGGKFDFDFMIDFLNIISELGKLIGYNLELLEVTKTGTFSFNCFFQDKS
jgi:hypothetical protein